MLFILFYNVSNCIIIFSFIYLFIFIQYTYFVVLFNVLYSYILTHYAMHKVVDEIVYCMYIMFYNTLALAITTLREIKCTFSKVTVNK